VANGQVISVRANGLPAGAQVEISTCAAQSDPQASPTCVTPRDGGGVVDRRGQLVLSRYAVVTRDAASGLDCRPTSGCELAWYPLVGQPPYVRQPIQARDP
jgi:hypothetical protein